MFDKMLILMLSLLNINIINITLVKLQSELHVTKQVNGKFPKRVEAMEHQRQANAQFSKWEGAKIVKIPKENDHKYLEDKFHAIFEKIGCRISSESVEVVS